MGTILRLLRTQKKISQANMASLLGVTQNFLSQLENDKKIMSHTTLERIANILGISKELLIIASCDIPPELPEKKKKHLEKMKASMLSYILEKP